jgi:hypothetical protein
MGEKTTPIPRKRAFVLMPFKKPYDSYYPAIFKPALEAVGYEVKRADDLFAPRPIMLDVQRLILEADLVLCEMSGKNPNVFYELGLAHATGRPAILVSNSEKDIPFDLRHVRIIVYDYTSAGWETKLREAIKAAALAVETSETIWPPPLVPDESQEVARAAAMRDALLVRAQAYQSARMMGMTKSEIEQVIKAMSDKP